jgi:type III restriction enzyme
LSFFDQPILNSPYEVPSRHHALDDEGQPLDVPPAEGRRESKLLTPAPKPRKRRLEAAQESLAFGDQTGVSHEGQEYNPTPIIKCFFASWRSPPYPGNAPHQ